MSGLSGQGGAFGPGHVRLDGRGAGPEPEGLTGQGVLKLDKGTLPATPMLSRLESALGRTRIVGAAYKASETPFRIARGRVSFERFRLEAETVGLDLGGWTSVDGAVDMTLGVRAPRAQVRIAEIPAEVIDALTEDDGWVRIPFRVTGTRLAPRVVPDMSALTAQAKRGGVKVLQRKAADKLAIRSTKNKKKKKKNTIQKDVLLFNSSEKRLARILLLLANFGKEGRPEPVVPKISQETLAEMVGTTRSRISHFMNKFRKLGFVEYNGRLEVHSSLLHVVLHD